MSVDEQQSTGEAAEEPGSGPVADAEEQALDPADGAGISMPDAMADPSALPGDEGQEIDESAFSDDEAPEPEVTADGEADLGAQGERVERTTLPAGDIGRAHLKGLIEALVFVSDRPVSLNEIAKSAGKADRKLVRSLVDELRHDYQARGIHLEEVAGGLIFRTNPAYGPFIRDAAAKKPVKMSRAQLEALAIIAYRQPLTRPEVDEIRGVDSGPVLKMLLDRDLIRILGKKDEPGRPLLYGTTPVFLEFFGLKSLKDLPSLREFTELSDDSRKVFDREMSEVEADANAENLAAAASAMAEAQANTPGSRPEDFEDPPTDPQPDVHAPPPGEPREPDPTQPDPTELDARALEPGTLDRHE